MNYELAKKLKDAGFPQTGISGVMIGNDGAEYIWGAPFPTIINPYYIPTLSELIEACGDEFCELNKAKGTTKHWFSFAWSKWEDGNFKGEKIGSHGTSPEEAVANLFIVLNTNG